MVVITQPKTNQISILASRIKEAEEKLESYPNHPEYLVVMASLRSLRAGITFERQEIKVSCQAAPDPNLIQSDGVWVIN